MSIEAKSTMQHRRILLAEENAEHSGQVLRGLHYSVEIYSNSEISAAYVLTIDK